MATKETEVKKQIKLSPEVVELSEKIKLGLSVERETGIGSEKTDTYYDNLPEGVTRETDKAVDDYRSLYVPAAVKAAGDLHVEALAGNKKLTQATTQVKVGAYNELSVVTDRSKVFTNSFGDGEKVTRYGNTTAVYDVKAGNNSGDLKKARKLIAEAAAASLGGKK